MAKRDCAITDNVRCTSGNIIDGVKWASFVMIWRLV